MRLAASLVGMVAVAVPTAALCCSCGDPDTMTERQLQYLMRELLVVGYGRVDAPTYPAACRVAPIRWFKAAIGARVPVTYRLTFQKVVWGRSPRTIRIVQYQQAGWSRCSPPGSAACESPLPTGDAFWPIRRSVEGDLVYAGRCGLMVADRFFRPHARPDGRTSH